MNNLLLLNLLLFVQVANVDSEKSEVFALLVVFLLGKMGINMANVSNTKK